MGERRGTKGLELWCRRMTEGYPGVRIDNMTTSWRDGLAFCAIIHHFRPDLIDFSKLNKDDVYHNNELAFRVAEQYLGIPALLEPEDMVEYSVPDRLSILTYLSQFYQAFAVPQGSNSSARIAVKRPQTSPDHGIVSPASTSPPSKVALTGTGRVRREPCAKCGLPVFIAERLNVGKHLYHRTCFRCARCNSQLTLANYYETENGDFCCEICPDEEKLHTKSSPEKSVLSRSMSDEEKTATLKTFSNEPDDYSSMFETALESIRDDSSKKEFTLTRDEGSSFLQARSQFIQSQMEQSTDSGNDEEPPDLPKSVPPILDKSDLSISEGAGKAKDTVVKHSDNSDIGIPSNRLEVTVNLNSSIISKPHDDSTSVRLEKTRNVVTKEKPAVEGDTSLVKARMRLFESNNEFRKSDVNKNSQNINKVPAKIIESPTTHDNVNKTKTIPLVKLEDLENFEQLSKNDLSDSTSITTDIEDNSSAKAPVTSYKDIKHSSNNISDDNISINKKLDDSILTNSPTDKEDIKDTQSSTPILSEEFREDDTDESEVVNIKTATSPEETTHEQDITKSKSVSQHIQIETSFLSDTESDNKEQLVVSPSEDSLSKAEPTSEKDESPRKETNIEPTDEDVDYPTDLNPFGDEEEGKSEEVKGNTSNVSLNPFEDEEDDENDQLKHVEKPVPSPRLRKKLSPTDDSKKIGAANRSQAYMEQVGGNPFESDDDESTKTPVPAARKKKVIAAPKINLNPFGSDDEEDNEENIKPVPKPRISVTRTTLEVPEPRQRELGNLSVNSNFGSNSSISSGSIYGSARKKKPAPRPPILIKPENYESAASSLASSPSHSVQHSPRSTPKYRKTRKAPPPPTSSTPVQLRKDTENNNLPSAVISPIKFDVTSSEVQDSEKTSFKTEQDFEQDKIAKDEMNRNRQSQNISLQSPTSSENSSSLSAPNKSTFGKWKRHKGKAPNRPIPQKRTIKCLPMSEIRRELEIIEIQQQGLERQGVRLEQIIREKCEGSGVDSITNSEDDSLPIDVEDLMLQLFELVNEKNELFRKQTELMYLRRQQRLEEEHADVEYQIRCLMLQPEANKTDSDKAREEELINRLVEIVERRNEIIECLEMDRVREAEEDDSINNHINLYTLKRDGEKQESDKTKKEKDKDKKKHKKEKKLKLKDKGHKIDVDKDIDESERFSTLEKKKKKKFNIF